MNALLQTGSSLSACGHAQAGGRVSVPLKSDFLSIDATGWPKGATDLDGRPRTRGSTIDMGCYSFNAPGFMLMLK